MEVVIVAAAAADAAPRCVAYGLLDVQRVLKRGIVGFMYFGRATCIPDVNHRISFRGRLLRQHSIIDGVDPRQVKNTCTRGRAQAV